MPDVFVRRGGAEYAQGFASLLPRGPAWPRTDDSVLMRVVRGLSEIWGVRVDASIATLLEIESDPRRTINLLAEWERAFGLPDECVGVEQSISARHEALIQRMTMLGGQSRAFFIAVAEALGYTITIEEFSPFMVGVSCVGLDDHGWEIGPPEMRFYWRVRVANARLTWFRASQGQVGVDHHLNIDVGLDLECLLKRWKPAQTEIVFAYGDGDLDSMAGTP